MTLGIAVVVKWANGTTVYDHCDYLYSKTRKKYYIYKKLGPARREVITRWRKEAVTKIERVPMDQVQILKPVTGQVAQSPVVQ